MSLFGNKNNVLSYSENEVKTQASLISKVYFWMFLALLITVGSAFFALVSGFLYTIISNQLFFYGLIIVELGVVIYASSRYMNMSTFSLAFFYLLYAVLNGITLSIILIVYTGSSIILALSITAGTFLLMSIYGYFTKADLTSFGNILFMALLGLILASVVNIFLGSSTMEFILSWAGVIIFTGLVAYDTNKIKLLQESALDNESIQKLAIMGALGLYLDFINLFLHLLRLFGDRR